MKGAPLALAAIGAFTLGSCSDRDGALPSPPTSEMTAADQVGNPNGRVVGVAYGEMSSRAVVVRESSEGALTACFWHAAPGQSRPLGCAPLD